MTVAQILLAFAFVVAPGSGLALALLPPHVSVAARVALVVPLGYAAVASISFVLAVAGALRPSLLLPAYVLAVAAAWGAALRWHGLRAHLRSGADEMASHRWAYLLGLTVILLFGATRLTYSPTLNLADQTPLRYWADGVEIADAGRIPDRTLQWGVLAPPAESKVLLNTFGAASSLVLGRGPLAPMGALLVVLSVGLLVTAFGLAWELGLRSTAALVPILLFANSLFGPRNLTLDLVNYKAENWGRLVMLAGVILAVRAVRDRESAHRRRTAMLSGVLLGIAAGTHLVAAVVGVSFVLLYGLAWVALDRGVRPVAATVGLGLGAFLLTGVAAFTVPPGDVGFEGAVDRAAYREIVADLNLPPTFDPTRYLALGEVDQPVPPEGFYDPPSELYHEYVRSAVGQAALRRPLLWIFPVAMLLALAALLVWGPSTARATGIAAVGLLLLILVVALAFNYRYDVYVLAEFGPRRLFDYTGLSVVLLAAAAVETAVARVAAGRAPRPKLAGGLLVVLAVTAFVLPANVASGEREAFFASALDPLEWVEENVPCEGRVLADRRTLATFETMAGRAGPLEGMGPYLRPDLLGVAVRALLEGRDFFAAPSSGEPYLRENAVAAVVVTSYGQTLGGVGGPLKVGHVPVDDLDALTFLEPVARSETVTVYRVVGFDPDQADLPRVTGLPGYCRDG
jgi:hypothetical protein